MILSYSAKQYQAAKGVTIVAAPLEVQEPRTVGGSYWSDQCQSAYTVVAIEVAPCGCKTANHRKACKGGRLVQITCANDNGEVRNHATPFTHKVDGIVVSNSVAA